MNTVRCFNLSLTTDFSQVFTSDRGLKTVSTVCHASPETVETVSHILAPANTPLKQGVNERGLA